MVALDDLSFFAMLGVSWWGPLAVRHLSSCDLPAEHLISSLNISAPGDGGPLISFNCLSSCASVRSGGSAWLSALPPHQSKGRERQQRRAKPNGVAASSRCHRRRHRPGRGGAPRFNSGVWGRIPVDYRLRF